MTEQSYLYYLHGQRRKITLYPDGDLAEVARWQITFRARRFAWVPWPKTTKSFEKVTTLKNAIAMADFMAEYGAHICIVKWPLDDSA